MSRLTDDEFVDFMITGPDGKDVPWRGKSRIDSKSYSASDFAVLRSGEKLSSKTTVSLKNGHGFMFNQPGHYTLMAEYSLGPPEYFTPQDECSDRFFSLDESCVLCGGMWAYFAEMTAIECGCAWLTR